jgi:hypothetical protein
LKVAVTNRENRMKTQLVTITFLLFVTLLLSLLLPSAFDISAQIYENSLTENTSKDACPEKETVEENEFFGDENTLSNLIYLPNKANTLVNYNPLFLVPKFSLDIPIPPPKTYTS